MFEKLKNWYRALPDKKRYLEFVTALLSIPVLITVIMSNVTNLRRNRETTAPNPQPTTVTEKIIIITQKEKNNSKEDDKKSPTPTEKATPTLAPTNLPTATQVPEKPTSTPTPVPPTPTATIIPETAN